MANLASKQDAATPLDDGDVALGSSVGKIHPVFLDQCDISLLHSMVNRHLLLEFGVNRNQIIRRGAFSRNVLYMNGFRY